MSFTRVSKEAEEVLMEILEHEHDSNYWKIRFDSLSNRDDIVLRGCFKELSEDGLINAEYADNYPYLITIHHFTTYANRYIDAKAAVSVPL